MDELENIQPNENLQKNQFVKQQLEARKNFNQIGLWKLVQPNNQTRDYRNNRNISEKYKSMYEHIRNGEAKLEVKLKQLLDFCLQLRKFMLFRFIKTKEAILSPMLIEHVPPKMKI